MNRYTYATKSELQNLNIKPWPIFETTLNHDRFSNNIKSWPIFETTAGVSFRNPRDFELGSANHSPIGMVLVFPIDIGLWGDFCFGVAFCLSIPTWHYNGAKYTTRSMETFVQYKVKGLHSVPNRSHPLAQTRSHLVPNRSHLLAQIIHIWYQTGQILKKLLPCMVHIWWQ